MFLPSSQNVRGPDIHVLTILTPLLLAPLGRACKVISGNKLSSVFTEQILFVVIHFPMDGLDSKTI